MKLAEAIFLFERLGGQDAPLSSIDELDLFELIIYYKDFEPGENIEKIITAKLKEYERDIERSNQFIIRYGQFSENEETETDTLKYLTELTLLLAKIGISNIHELSVYEAHRLIVIYKET